MNTIPRLPLAGKRALVTGAARGIGAAIALKLAEDGANVAITYEKSAEKAEALVAEIRAIGRKAIAIRADAASTEAAKATVEQTVAHLGGLDILVNNAAEQHVRNKLEDITAEQLHATFRTNVFSMFYLTIAALPHLQRGSAVINTASITAYKGNPKLIDYSSTKGAIVSFTRALASNLAAEGIRVNGVAPGPVWTPLNPTDKEAPDVAEFGSQAKMKRPAQPEEIAPAYVFLASPQTSSYITGEILPIIGGY